jgi:hypothetical protein
VCHHVSTGLYEILSGSHQAEDLSVNGSIILKMGAVYVKCIEHVAE